MSSSINPDTSSHEADPLAFELREPRVFLSVKARNVLSEFLDGPVTMRGLVDAVKAGRSIRRVRGCGPGTVRELALLLRAEVGAEWALQLALAGMR